MPVRTLILCSFLLSLGPQGLAHAGDYKVGLAKMVVTPEGALWLSGYGARTRPAEGKANDLYAKAVVFEMAREAHESADGARLVLVTLDVGSVSPYMTERVAAGAQKRFGVPRGSLVLNCSHTHCAPEVAAERRVFHDLSDEEEAKLAQYIEGLTEKLVDLIGAAITDLRPARLSVSGAEADFAFNRRHPSGIDRNGVTDREVPVLRIADPDGTLRGVLFGYACHNTTLDFQQYCGDYAGFAQQYVEEAHPGAIALFVMGCGGDQNPQPRHGPKGLEHAKRHGRTLADAVEKALAGAQRAVHGPLRVAYDVATLELEPLPPLDQLRSANRARDKTADRKVRYLQGVIDAGKDIPLTQPCPLHAASFGDDLLVIFISGETVVDYALRCKRELAGPAGPAVWVAGYCDDVFAYLPSRRVLLEGGYEGRDSIVHQLMATPFLPNVEERVMAGVTKLVAQANGDAK
ncbi:MAG: neutral/alkaline non-lysosomal ceramidase N-terminal domain-containing protein [Planctomycetia bacterium]|nr:neutral/alkaline non-lysosomal ceramidase N-terminal domain-containing protein [Planctomycetia bacterium]